MDDNKLMLIKLHVTLIKVGNWHNIKHKMSSIYIKISYLIDFLILNNYV